MTGFVDEAVIEVFSGNGGNGAISFRREKSVPKGGPDGGDGGKGGNALFIVKNNLRTLYHLKVHRVYKSENGESGKKKRQNGKDGADVYIPVPPGSEIRDSETGEIIKEFKTPGEEYCFLKGGRGGKGNWHFATSVNQTPRFAQDGEPGQYRKLVVELKLIADIGLVGLPNAGKSTLLSVLTNAHPKIASYPFTTKIPNLGVLKIYERDIVIADIPGIIEGASKGAGLGFKFLKHISRTFLIVFLIDLTDDSFIQSVQTLSNELEMYSPELSAKESLLIGTKLDIEENREKLSELKKAFPDKRVMGISAVTGEGIPELKKMFLDLVESGVKAKNRMKTI
ncbi:MAG: GTPase ObgE [Spirochaetales bacterium]|nr:GTPase ObgE [Spirochaetales bacterium]